MTRSILLSFVCLLGSAYGCSSSDKAASPGSGTGGSGTADSGAGGAQSNGGKGGTSSGGKGGTSSGGKGGTSSGGKGGTGSGGKGGTGGGPAPEAGTTDSGMTDGSSPPPVDGSAADSGSSTPCIWITLVNPTDCGQATAIKDYCPAGRHATRLENCVDGSLYAPNAGYQTLWVAGCTCPNDIQYSNWNKIECCLASVDSGAGDGG